MIDNYDSFVYNLVDYFRQLGQEVQVVRNDAVTVAEIRALRPQLIVLSPGPGNPAGAGCCLEVVQQLQGEIPIFGVCLGHQIIAEALGAQIIPALRPQHGKVQAINHQGQGVFQELPQPLTVTRYHSLVVDPDSLPPELVITALSPEGEIMGLRHTRLALEGVQFHPEAILSQAGLALLRQALRSKPCSSV